VYQAQILCAHNEYEFSGVMFARNVNEIHPG
jgi:hypothetical protein